MISAKGAGIGVNAESGIIRISGLPKSWQMEIITSLSDGCSVSGSISMHSLNRLLSRSIAGTVMAFTMLNLCAFTQALALAMFNQKKATLRAAFADFKLYEQKILISIQPQSL